MREMIVAGLKPLLMVMTGIFVLGMWVLFFGPKQELTAADIAERNARSSELASSVRDLRRLGKVRKRANVRGVDTNEPTAKDVKKQEKSKNKDE